MGDFLQYLKEAFLLTPEGERAFKTILGAVGDQLEESIRNGFVMRSLNAILPTKPPIDQAQLEAAYTNFKSGAEARSETRTREIDRIIESLSPAAVFERQREARVAKVRAEVATVPDSDLKDALLSQIEDQLRLASLPLAADDQAGFVRMEQGFSAALGQIEQTALAASAAAKKPETDWVDVPDPRGTGVTIAKNLIDTKTGAVVRTIKLPENQRLADTLAAEIKATKAKTAATEEATASSQRQTLLQGELAKAGVGAAFDQLLKTPATNQPKIDLLTQQIIGGVSAAVRLAGETDFETIKAALQVEGLPEDAASFVLGQAGIAAKPQALPTALPASAPPVSPVSQRLVAGTGAGRIQAGLATEQTARPPAAAAIASFRAQEQAAQQVGTARPSAAIPLDGRAQVEAGLAGYAGALAQQVGSGKMTAGQAMGLFEPLVAALHQLATNEGVDTLGFDWATLLPKIANMPIDEAQQFVTQLGDIVGAAITQRKQQRVEDRQKELDRLAVEERGQNLRISARSEIQRRGEARGAALAQLPIDRQTAERGFLGTLSGLQNLLPPIGAGAKIGGANIYTDLAQRIGAPNPGFAGVGVEHIPTPDFDAMFERAKQEIMAAYPQTTVEELVK